MKFFILRGRVPQEVPSVRVFFLDLFIFLFCGQVSEQSDQVLWKPDFWMGHMGTQREQLTMT